MFNGHYYYGYNNKVNFASALSFSAQQSMHLVVVSHNLELDLILRYFSTYSWAAASDQQQETVWRYMAGPENDTVVTYFHWSSMYEPNGGYSENCLQINHLGYNDLPCADLEHFVVEFECDVSPSSNNLSPCSRM